MDKNIYENLLNNLHEGVYFLDPERKITYWNQGAERITGFSKLEVLGRQCSDNILIPVNEQGTKLCNEHCPAKQTLSEGKNHAIESYFRHKEGYRLPVFIRIIPLLDQSGSITGAAVTFIDNSPRVSMPQRIHELDQMALLDNLTQIGNRRYLEMHLTSRLDEMRRYQLPFSVILVDIDRFKQLNETYSIQIGDKVLKMVAQTLFNNIRFFDIVGRWGGKEFLVIVLNVDESKLDLVANKLRLLVSQSSIRTDSKIIGVTVSIGATLANSSDTKESLIMRVDRLTYQSKKLGMNRVSAKINYSD